MCLTGLGVASVLWWLCLEVHATWPAVGQRRQLGSYTAEATMPPAAGTIVCGRRVAWSATA